MAITIGDVANIAGVSRSTVSTVLSNAKSTVRISDGTRQRVLRIANEMNYRPSFTARSLVKGKVMTLGYICGGINTPHFGELASEILHEAELRGYHLVVSVTEWNQEKELQCIDDLLDGRVDGMVASVNSIIRGTQQYERIIENNFPVITTENGSCDKIPGVITDYRPGMEEAVRLLQSCGHKRIGYVELDCEEAESSLPFSKYSAFHDSCRKHGVTGVDYKCGNHGVRMDGIVKLARQIADCKDKTWAFVVFSDYAAMGFIRGLRQAGLEVPRDIDVIGIDGTEWGQCSPLALTSIYQDRKEIASTAVNLLLNKIDNPSSRNDGDDMPESLIKIPSKLIVGETVKRI